MHTRDLTPEHRKERLLCLPPLRTDVSFSWLDKTLTDAVAGLFQSYVNESEGGGEDETPKNPATRSRETTTTTTTVYVFLPLPLLANHRDEPRSRLFPHVQSVLSTVYLWLTKVATDLGIDTNPGTLHSSRAMPNGKSLDFRVILSACPLGDGKGSGQTTCCGNPDGLQRLQPQKGDQSQCQSLPQSQAQPHGTCSLGQASMDVVVSDLDQVFCRRAPSHKPDVIFLLLGNEVDQVVLDHVRTACARRAEMGEKLGVLETQWNEVAVKCDVGNGDCGRNECAEGPALSTPEQSRSSRHYSSAVGGTFDHLHIGHKVLLTMTAFALDDPSAPLSTDGKPGETQKAEHVPEQDPSASAATTPHSRRMIIGITNDTMLAKKKFADFIQPWPVRAEGVAAFLLGVMYFGPRSADDGKASGESESEIGAAAATSENRHPRTVSLQWAAENGGDGGEPRKQPPPVVVKHMLLDSKGEMHEPGGGSHAAMAKATLISFSPPCGKAAVTTTTATAEAAEGSELPPSTCRSQSSLRIEISEIADPYGPTITDRSLSVLVVSQETLSGGEAVNERRREKGWDAMEILSVGVLKPPPEELEELTARTTGPPAPAPAPGPVPSSSSSVAQGEVDPFVNKFSSTGIRELRARQTGV